MEAMSYCRPLIETVTANTILRSCVRGGFFVLKKYLEDMKAFTLSNAAGLHIPY